MRFLAPLVILDAGMTLFGRGSPGFAAHNWRIEQDRKVALPKCIRGEERSLYTLVGVAPALVIECPERAVAPVIPGQHDGTTEYSSELIAAQPVLGRARRSGR